MKKYEALNECRDPVVGLVAKVLIWVLTRVFSFNMEYKHWSLLSL